MFDPDAYAPPAGRIEELCGRARSLDSRQRRLLASWWSEALCQTSSIYSRFMSAWIAFNAFCYARYAGEAQQNRADLSHRARTALDGLRGALPISGTLRAGSGRLILQILDPRLVITIRQKYTEDRIFSAFARDYQIAFRRWLDDSEFRSARDGLLSAIQRDLGHYVINMARVRDFKPDMGLAKLHEHNVVAAILDAERANLGEFKGVLYQVRCNVFHGEKTPGEPNDDRIVRAALPFLLMILERAVEANGRPPASVRKTRRDPACAHEQDATNTGSTWAQNAAEDPADLANVAPPGAATRRAVPSCVGSRG